MAEDWIYLTSTNKNNQGTFYAQITGICHYFVMVMMMVTMMMVMLMTKTTIIVIVTIIITIMCSCCVLQTADFPMIFSKYIFC